MTRPENSFANHTLAAFVANDEKVTYLADHPYTKAASEERINIAKAGIEAKGHKVHVVADKDEAFELIKSLIPAGASVNTAHSTTLEEIGFIDYLKGENPWNNVRGQVLAEKDPAKQNEIRRLVGSTADYFLTSMAAITEAGELAHADQTGTKVGAVSFSAGKVIVVASSNKIVKDLDEAWKRVTEFCEPLAAAYSREVFKFNGMTIGNYQVIHSANPFNPDRIQVILIKEALGF
ncbi:hypothetical protein DFQ27_001878 [Actinomortierella ambigua]|uniref:LUD domain-containing protein n=1 Tax=Actinomortierella ambigua TaxID=1343610 RepID=A0A9P6U824_9FUNG|nr:hypothetical protein DFQ26_009908 [Actinomortierella ambigua]KAG0263192.1 hypothetical protein DFQ27_001878 [Actinomortierella ambigua]